MNSDLQKHAPATLSSLPPDIDYHRFSRRAARLRSQAFTSGWRQFGDVLKLGLQAWYERQREKRAVVELKRLNRRELRDLGLYPGDLDRLQQGGKTTKAMEFERIAGNPDYSRKPPKLRVVPHPTVAPGAEDAAETLRKCG